MRFVFATHNKGKIKEMREILAGLTHEILSLDDMGITEEVEETGETFQENALIKARFAVERTDLPAFAEDAGICIAALNGKPGVRSARWAGEGANGRQIATHTLEQVKHVPLGHRQAYFENVVACIMPGGAQHCFPGRVDGSLAFELRGNAHDKLPYDWIFIPEGYEQTFAELGDEQKNALSHRGKAFRAFRNFLEQM